MVMASPALAASAAAVAKPYIVNVVTLDSGVTVKEFVSTANNRVFCDEFVARLAEQYS